MAILRIFKYVAYIYIVLLILKMIVATFDGKLVKYSLMNTSENSFGRINTWDNKKPKLLPLNPTTYKLNNGIIISNTSGFLHEKKSPNCLVQDLKNWECWGTANILVNEKIKKVSEMERMERGKYTQFSDAWTTAQYSEVNTYNDVSELAYNLAGCRWDFYKGVFYGITICPLRFLWWH